MLYIYTYYPHVTLLQEVKLGRNCELDSHIHIFAHGYFVHLTRKYLSFIIIKTTNFLLHNTCNWFCVIIDSRLKLYNILRYYLLDDYIVLEAHPNLRVSILKNKTLTAINKFKIKIKFIFDSDMILILCKLYYQL